MSSNVILALINPHRRGMRMCLAFRPLFSKIVKRKTKNSQVENSFGGLGFPVSNNVILALINVSSHYLPTLTD